MPRSDVVVYSEQHLDEQRLRTRCNMGFSVYTDGLQSVFFLYFLYLFLLLLALLTPRVHFIFATFLLGASKPVTTGIPNWIT